MCFVVVFLMNAWLFKLYGVWFGFIGCCGFGCWFVCGLIGGVTSVVLLLLIVFFGFWICVWYCVLDLFVLWFGFIVLV